MAVFKVEDYYPGNAVSPDQRKKNLLAIKEEFESGAFNEMTPVYIAILAYEESIQRLEKAIMAGLTITVEDGGGNVSGRN